MCEIASVMARGGHRGLSICKRSVGAKARGPNSLFADVGVHTRGLFYD